MVTTKPAKDRPTNVLSCPDCGEKATIVDDASPADVNVIVETWRDAHASCADTAELSNWKHLVHVGDDRVDIQHGGDLGKLTPISRPSWAPQDRDDIKNSLPRSRYRSETAAVAASHWPGWDAGGKELVFAHVNVSAVLYGNGVRAVGMTIVKQIPEGAKHPTISFTPDEACQLAEVLTAAAHLVVTP